MTNYIALSEAIQKARDDFANALEARWPRNTKVPVAIGGRIFEIEITGYGRTMYDEACMYGHNTKTGSSKKFHWRQIVGTPESNYGMDGSYKFADCH